MADLIVKVLINAVGVFAAIQIVPQISFPAAENLDALATNWPKLLAVALILALVNSYIKPIAKILSFPITLMSLGLFTFILNALLLLLAAFISGQFELGFTIGGFPPDFGADAFISALLGAIVISIVSLLLGLVNTGRKVVI